jgi:drug/metabolite transporter (DMT)-like permease
MRSYIELLLLSAIWGGSFLFMRVATPVLGPAWLVFGRVGIAAVFLFFVLILLKRRAALKENFAHYTILAFFNSALPFFLFAYAASSLNTSQLSVLNATAPAWGYLIGVFLKNEEFIWVKVFGLVLGLVGVWLMIGEGANASINFLHVVMGLLAAFSYGISTNYTKKGRKVDPYLNAFGSMLMATVIVSPGLFVFPIRGELTQVVLISVLAIGVLCSGVAYILYFRIVRDLGPSSALTVAFLIPVFATAWGMLALNEVVTATEVIGASVVIIGTYLVTKKRT